MSGNRAFIIHGYLSYPEEAWLPWFRTELEKRGYAVSLPAMPHPDRPEIHEWMSFIANLVGEPDGNTVMVGHSLGCQAVIRYLELVGNAGKSVGTTVLVAGSFPGGMSPEEAERRSHGNKALLPWFATAVNAATVRKAAGKCTVILSEDDPYIHVGQAKASFLANLGAEIILENGKGHFNEDDKVLELPSALNAVISSIRSAGPHPEASRSAPR